VTRARLNIFVEPEHARRLEDISAHRGVSKSSVIAAALSSFLSPDATDQRETATAKRLDMPMERVIVTVDRHGNTSSGSVPLALDAAVRSGKVERGQLLLLEAFGGGFTWGSVLLRY